MTNTSSPDAALSPSIGGVPDDAGSSPFPVIEVDDSPILDLASFTTSTSAPSSSSSDEELQFFVRLFSPPSLVLRTSPDEMVRCVMERLESIIGFPKHEQRLIYHGRQLDCEKTLLHYGVKNGETIDLISSLPSARWPRAWRIANDIVDTVCFLEGAPAKEESVLIERYAVDYLVKQFLTTTLLYDTTHRREEVAAILLVFISSNAISALVKLYLSPVWDNRVMGEKSIRIFLSPKINLLPERIHRQCVPILYHFCKMLGAYAGTEDQLYAACRSTLASTVKNSRCSMSYWIDLSFVAELMLLYSFISELIVLMEKELSDDFEYVEVTTKELELSNIIIELSNFLAVVCRIIQGWKGKQLYDATDLKYENVISSIFELFIKLVGIVDHHLKKLGKHILPYMSEQQRDGNRLQVFSNLLSLLTVIKVFLKMFEEGQDLLHSTLLKWRPLLNVLLKSAGRNPALRWFLKYKDITDFEARMNLVLMMLPDWEIYVDPFEMLIDRSQLLAESFTKIDQCDAMVLHRGLYLEFKDEEVGGPGVLREWFCLLCQAIFDPKNALFLQCPNDRRRLFPNSASSMNPLHLEYFHFSGRIIALALTHKIQVGIMFDRVFFIQLAGERVSLEDVQSADPELYSSCKQIIEMDSAFLDSDALGLTFAREVEVLGSKKTLELCPGGKDIIVSSRNRREYIDLLVYDLFVKSIKEQVTQFAQGFSDILTNSKHQQFLFHSLDLEDFNRMLYGNNETINVKEWRLYTNYIGYKETDRQIKWFWEIVQDMSDDQRKTLLSFWTSVMYLPVNGFGGLSSRLDIYKTLDLQASLPTASTCFFRLSLPPYKKKSVMRDRLYLIARDYVSCGFGFD